MKTTDLDAVLMSTNNGTMLDGIHSFLSRDHGPQIVSRFFRTLCGLLSVKKLSTTAYHPQTNSQTLQYHKTIIALFGQYWNEQQSNRDLFVQQCTHLYSLEYDPNEKRWLCSVYLLSMNSQV